MEDKKKLTHAIKVIDESVSDIYDLSIKMQGSIWGLVVGDALGVPVEFLTRAELKINPVIDMLGYGTHHQPKGTWSDDSSMMLATIEWLNDDIAFDYSKLMDKFCMWLMHGGYTPYGDAFDCGITVRRALVNYRGGTKTLLCGERTEFSNGNGSLMRLLPAVLLKYQDLASLEKGAVQFIYDISRLTHAHARSKVACFIYAEIIASLLQEDDTRSKFAIVCKALLTAKEYLSNKELDVECQAEVFTFQRLFAIDSFVNLDEKEIKSTGYVVDTLEAAVWCFLTTNSYKECVLKAVNLGDDTDTVGAVAGAMAGAYYGMSDIPVEWLKVLPKKEWIEKLSRVFIERLELCD